MGKWHGAVAYGGLSAPMKLEGLEGLLGSAMELEDLEGDLGGAGNQF
jgi:hypothetical protein